MTAGSAIAGSSVMAAAGGTSAAAERVLLGVVMLQLPSKITPWSTTSAGEVMLPLRRAGA